MQGFMSAEGKFNQKIDGLLVDSNWLAAALV